jgi:hypothetical protein
VVFPTFDLPTIESTAGIDCSLRPSFFDPKNS